jgi:adenine-specific DNA-methyltransferase
VGGYQMKQTVQTPREFINPLLSKRSVIQSDFEKFENNVKQLLHVNTSESEEHQKNAVRDFLVHSFGYAINTKGKIDWAIFKDGKVEVLIEAKRLDNVSEMITPSELNRKALHEAILYFMQERDEGNNDLKHIIILTAFKWFVFDAKEFDRLFWSDRQIKKIYTDFKSPSILGDKTKDFYEAIAKHLKVNVADEIEIKCAHFDLSKELNKKELIAIYKLLSPDSLLKAFNPNDANTLNREFYSELLYILGLEEVKEGGKKLIGRAKSPQLGSLYENIGGKLTQYGKPNDFESIIKLMIIWINRILFLKLLESQIVKWNTNPSFKFLNAKKIDDFDKLEMLFFEVLAKKPRDRNHREFDYIPYLNSSLFELHEMEEKSLKISNLADDTHIAYYTKTVIKDEKSTKKTGEVCTLHYLFEFLDAYDFSSEGSEEIVHDNKTLINASVLGLIFEKLNGYKDGSFYTPSFITMYMAKESLTKAVLAKFLTCKGWDCQNLTELHNKIEDIKEANDIINSLTLCDPAVGSGHFLVSALNEILTIKSTLGILCDDNGKKLKDYRLELANDELIVKDDEGEIFEYQRQSSEKTRVQKALFKEKQRIIENSLFGVDTNPNSVNICRLRLWIELLKNAYYKEDGTLDTLPNIDINIKCGNSLISRFELKDELKIKNIKHEIENYKQKVSDYKENLGTKKEVLESINALKAKFNLSLKAEWKVQKTLNDKLLEYYKEFGFDKLSNELALKCLDWRNQVFQPALFGDKNEKKQNQLLEELSKLQAQIEEIETGKIYQNAFEWRFEFPEVLDEKGDFVGFDVVIGNPPYISLSKIKEIDYGRLGYEVFDKTGDILALFFEKALAISRANVSFIVSNSWLKTKYGVPLKKLFETSQTQIINFEDSQIFEEATVESCIATIDKNKEARTELITIKNFSAKDATIASLHVMIENSAEDDSDALLMHKIESRGKPLKEWKVSINYGIKTGFNEAFIIDTATKEALCAKDTKSAQILKPILRGRDIQKYMTNWAGFWLINSHNNPPIQVDNYPAIKEHFNQFDTQLEKRQDKGKTPYNLRNCAYLADFEKPKIVWGEISDEPKFAYDETGAYAEATSFMMSGENLKYLLAFLNSKLSKWYFERISTTTGMGTNRWKKFKLELLPIAQTDDENPFIDLVDKILTCKASNPKANTAELEAQIDTMVYKLYDLSEEEIMIVEGKA